ncbi:MAG TPA: hypothetical protein VFE90_05060 [Myxococcales bacterium]|jgi:hypothetical protein|nr:hypothetical protein [Myxococcales bacterium]
MDAMNTGGTRTVGYDRVVLPGGRQLSRREFEALPLRERVGYLMEGTAQFFNGATQVTAADAMKG